MNDDRPFLILGGYGATGAATTAALRAGGHRVLTVGRSATLADVRLDVVADASSLADLARGARGVVNAAGLEHPAVAAAVTGVGCAFVDISANIRYLDRLESPADAPLVVGVGIAPGLSSALAAEVSRRAPGQAVDIGVVLGAGEEHGAAAQEGTLQLIGESFAEPSTGARVRNFSRGSEFLLPDGTGRRLLRADLSDQFEMTRELGVAVTTSFGLDTASSTAALAVASRIPFGRTLARRVRPSGSDAWTVMAASRDRSVNLAATGNGQSLATGRIAAATALRLTEFGHGISSMRAVLGLDALAAVEGITVHGA